MSNASGSNGKGTWIALMKAILGRKNGFFTTIDFCEFIGHRNKGNSPELATVEGSRFVAVNESPEANTIGILNVALMKKLGCPDEEFSATAKYKDPTSFSPQCLLAFFTQTAPRLPKQDGGLRSRLSYLFMPFEFIANPIQGTNQRQLDMSIKDNATTLIDEILLWGKYIVPNLLMFSGRQLLPRPQKVCDDTTSHYTGTSELPRDRATNFVNDYICQWEIIMGAPSTRTEVDAKFLAVTGGNAKEALPTCLMHVYPGTSRGYCTQLFESKSYGVYKCRLNGGLVWNGEGTQPAIVTVTLKPTVTLVASVDTGPATNRWVNTN